MKDNRLFNAPLSLQKANYLIKALDLAPSSHVVDLGCGHGALLQYIASHNQIIGVGVDSDTDLIQQANTEWATQTSDSDVQFVRSDAAQYLQAMSPADVIICIGAEYIFGGYTDLLELSKQKLNPDGKMLVGLVYWKQPPPSGYLALMDMEDNNPYYDLFATVELARRQGFIPLEVHRSNSDEWDIFESSTARQRYESKRIDKAWRWQSGYLKWGIDIMGFCYLILQNA